ncbi:hypothetical protein K9M42_02810 [Patescibacteria group bacterium]|nr:hypothetical protein [Patescibacteria group bacterium]
MIYTSEQERYIKNVNGEAHQLAVDIIGQLEQVKDIAVNMLDKQQLDEFEKQIRKIKDKMNESKKYKV